ncbi:MAG: hypothetical protein ISS57_17515 [Anaerolineales bacterium]|nr:hypothetical protein [Anaerolineales bacterium]
METILITVVNIIIVLVVILLLMLRRRGARSEHQELERLQSLQIIPPEGISVPITNSFSGLKPLGGVFGVSRNNLNPKLVLYDDRIEYRVIIKGSKRYGDIEQVKVRGGRQVLFIFYDSLLTLSVWLGNPEDRLTLLNFLRSRGVNLDEKARALLNG